MSMPEMDSREACESVRRRVRRDLGDGDLDASQTVSELNEVDGGGKMVSCDD